MNDAGPATAEPAGYKIVPSSGTADPTGTPVVITGGPRCPLGQSIDGGAMNRVSTIVSTSTQPVTDTFSTICAA